MLPTIVTVNPFMAKHSHKHRRKHNPHRAARRAHYRAHGKVHNRMHRHRRHHKVHNPFSMRGLTGSVVPALIGAGGAIATDVAMAYLPLPTQLQAGWMNILTRAAVAVGVGYVAGVAVNKQVGKEVAAGGLIVVAYGALKQALAPTLGASIKGLSGLADFGDYTPSVSGGYGDTGLMTGGAGLGAYMRAPMGAYMRPRLGAYMNPGSILTGIRAKQMAGYGGLGTYDYQGSEGSYM